MTDTPTVRQLWFVLEARALALPESVVRVLAEHLSSRPNDKPRALALARMLRDLGAGSPATLRALLNANAGPDDVLFRASRLLSRELWLSPAAQRTLTATFIH